MAFMRRRASSKNRFSYQVLESYWRNGQPRQRVLINLGPHPTLKAAIQDARCRHRQELCSIAGVPANIPAIRVKDVPRLILGLSSYRRGPAEARELQGTAPSTAFLGSRYHPATIAIAQRGTKGST